MKQRLIDANKLPMVNTIERIEGKDVFVTSWIPAESIANAPTVNAVPVEWIKKQLEKQEYRKLLIDYIEWSSCLEWLIDTWENENPARGQEKYHRCIFYKEMI